MLLILGCEIAYLHPILCQLGQSKQALFEFLGLFGAFIELLEFLSVVYLILQSSFHDLLADLLNALDEK